MKPKPLFNTHDLLEGESRGFSNTPDNSLFAIKKEGCIHLYKNSCPHLGIELEWLEHQFLDHSKSLIQCSTHGAQFVIDNGECVSGPCLGKALTSVAFTIDDQGLLWLSDDT